MYISWIPYFETRSANIGVMYSAGDGVARNKKKAVELYEQARAAGHADATFNLGAIKETSCTETHP